MASNASMDVGAMVETDRVSNEGQLERTLGMEDEVRPQAGPLPSKRGEIGYQEGIHGLNNEASDQPPEEEPSLPARHPADRDHFEPPPISAPVTSPDLRTPNTAGSNAPLVSPSPISPNDASGHSRKQSILSYIRGKQPLPPVAGISFRTFSTFIVQLCALAGTIVGWVMSSRHAPLLSSNSSLPMSANATQIFVHVTFGIVTLMQFIFLERTIFRLRAERFAYKHPSGILPTSRRRGGRSTTAMAFAPWNRPPLPTYAAALAQSGLGTGDVEDNIIAVPPPPAYGHTRGSTLLLAGFMSENLRAQRMRETIRSDGVPVSARSSWVSVGYSCSDEDGGERSSRPVSYKSHDSAWEHTLDAHRALRLEETLARLEDGGQRTPRVAREHRDGGR
ncbi:hypothetical protein NLI96_g6580 [Meripilus lineatus]|uniref:Uncharacterized protein n=1 Tax=Meripilus lineatus TaxID=2056292 RepID=A0AAD5YFS4_9APHY|nr:hypothetical protein NLI96_g6580 [Physisporinus lineatus]